MHYLVYQLTNTINGKVYIGVHQTANPDDGYMGSGSVLKRAIAKHGITSFKKDILFDFSSSEEMFAKERELVTEDFINRPDTYNLRVGGEGGWDYVNASGKASSIVNNKERFIQTDPAWLSKVGKIGAQNKRLLWEQYPERRELAKQHSSKGLRARYQNHPHHWNGKTHTVETKQKLSDVAKRRYSPAKNPSLGKSWMTNDLETKLVPAAEQDHLLQTGWRFGRSLK